MAEENFRVVFTYAAWRDLEEIVSYWTERGEAERGEQYAHDLPAAAIRELSDERIAHAGRKIRSFAFPDVQELPVFGRSYRILYLVKDSLATVEVLRFWHSHRDEPFQA